MITRHDIAFMVQEIISECNSRPKGADMIDLIDKYSAKFGKENNGMEVCDTTATKRLAKACCKNCNTYPDNLGPCETFCQGGNERCVYCDHELKCHPIAWHLIENSQQPPKER